MQAVELDIRHHYLLVHLLHYLILKVKLSHTIVNLLHSQKPI